MLWHVICYYEKLITPLTYALTCSENVVVRVQQFCFEIGLNV